MWPSSAKLAGPLTPLMNHKVPGSGGWKVSDLPVAFGRNQPVQLFRDFSDLYSWPEASEKHCVYEEVGGGWRAAPSPQSSHQPGDPAWELRALYTHLDEGETVTTMSTA